MAHSLGSIPVVTVFLLRIRSTLSMTDAAPLRPDPPAFSRRDLQLCFKGAYATLRQLADRFHPSSDALQLILGDVDEDDPLRPSKTCLTSWMSAL